MDKLFLQRTKKALDDSVVPTVDVLRRLTAYDLDAFDRFSMLIAGTEDMMPTLQHHTLEPLRGRIGYAQPLRPFSLEDTRNYISFHLQRVDASADILTDPAMRRIFLATPGRPRQINQLCLFLLIQAAISGIDTIDADFATAHINAHPFYQQQPAA